MSSSMKYLGGCTDPGEWRCSKDSEATDLGPGVSFSVMCGEDNGKGPYLFACYGLREDVNLPAVKREAERILAEYQKPNCWYPEGRKLQGPLREPRLEQWRSLPEVLANMVDPESMSLRSYKKINIEAGKLVWPLRHIVDAYTGSQAMTAQVIELAGLEAIRQIYDDCEVA